MHHVFNFLLVSIPGLVVLAQTQAQASGNSFDSFREVATFIVSILLAAAVNYVRSRSKEIKDVKESLPTKKEVADIKEENTLIRADIQLLTESLERVRKERDKALDDNVELQKLLRDTKTLPEEERQTNAQLAALNKELEDKFNALDAEFQIMKATSSAVDRFAVSLIQAVETRLNQIGIKGETN